MNLRLRTLSGAAAILAVAAPLVAQQPAQQPATARADRPIPSIPAVRADGPIQVDGRIDDAAWAAAPVISTLIQRDPDEGQPVSRATEVRVLYDDNALYVAATMAGPVTYRLGRRDMQLLDSDWLGITIDSYDDRRTGYRFMVNPGGVQRDAAVRMDGNNEVEDVSWNAVWEVAVVATDTGWSAEMRIPFSQLRFSGAAQQSWGLQVERIIGPRQERAHWSYQPKGEPGGVPTYGRLDGLEGVRPGRRLEALPFLVARGEYLDPRGNPFRSKREHGVSAGLDLLYRLTSHLTLNAAINPDFGQVEVDPAVVNLGVYEIFFPEQRPFFVEGSQIFRFTGNTSGGDLFYSRRIGRRPQRGLGGAADVPDVTRILGAAKVSGRTPDGWSVGVLNAVTAEETGRFMGGDGAETSVVEPMTNYFVTRLRRDTNAGRTSVGGIVTAVNRGMPNPALEAMLHSGAYAGGLDFRHEFGDRTWAVSGSVAGSQVTGSTDAITRTQRLPHHYFQRPDADHLRVDSAATSLAGYSGGAALRKQAGEHWTGSVAAALTAPSFEVNDLGFQTRTDRRDVQADVRYSERQPGSVLRDWAVSTFARHESNFDGDPVMRMVASNVETRTLNYWVFVLAAQLRGRAFDDRSTRGGPLIVRPGERVLATFISSDQRRPLVGSLNAAAVRNDQGDPGWETGASLSVRTSPRWNLSAGPYYSRGRLSAQYLATIPDPAATETFGNRYVFAPLDFTQLSANIRLNVALQPRLTLELFAQPLIFALDFDETMALAAPRTYDFQPFAFPVANPDDEQPSFDQTIRSLRGNAVLRWEWRPGSTLFVAWQQSREGVGRTGDFAWSRDPAALFETRPDNILVLKVNYWLNP